MGYSNVYLFLTDGFEETEALTTVDILRRAAIPVKTVSITGNQEVISKGKIIVKADLTFDTERLSQADALIFPGGAVLDGYNSNPNLIDITKRHAENGRLTAAICAAPVFLASMGLMKERVAVCYPSMKEELLSFGVKWGKDIVEIYDNFITSKGPATTPFFALALVEKMMGAEDAEKIRKAFLIDLVG